MAEGGMRRAERSREQDPRSVPWPVEGEADLVVVDTTWGELQPLEAAAGVRTVGELEVRELVGQGAVLVDCRTRGSFGGRTLPGSVLLPHDEIVERRGELDPARLSIVFCNGPQCPQSPDAVRRLLEAGYPATALAYYRGGLHDWVTMALPTQPRED
jgi:rhodanese-related sulfurtransferase